LGDLKNDDDYRELSASVMAQGLLVEVMLADYLRRNGASNPRELAASLEQASLKTDAFTGAARDDADADYLADVTVKMRQVCHGMIDRAYRGATGLAQ
jgi:hypothetical protein